MTVIAATIPPRDEPPFFITDTLISSLATPSARIGAPSGLIRLDKTTTLKPYRLEQKSAIINRNLFAAYAGDTLVGKAVIRALSKRFETDLPTPQNIKSVLEEYEHDLTSRDTSILISFLASSKRFEVLEFGGFVRRTYPDGTTFVGAGTGVPMLADSIGMVLSARLSTNADEMVPHQTAIAKLCTSISHISVNEGVSANFNFQFGGLLELTRSWPTIGFERMPSTLLVLEMFKLEHGQAKFVDGGYLTYGYVNDILVFRRFGAPRAKELSEAFGSHYFGGTVKPLLRQPSDQENKEAADRFFAKDFHDTSVQVFTLINVDRPNPPKVIFTGPSSKFRIVVEKERVGVHHSPEFLADIARRLAE